MEAAFAYSAPAPRRRVRKVAILAGMWLLVAGIAFAAWSRNATGTVTVTTSSPDAVNTVELVGGLDFQDAGTTELATFRVTGTDSRSYSGITTGPNAGVVSSGPCAGLITIPAGQSRAFQDDPTGVNPGLMNSAGDIVYVQDLQVTIAANAPQSCSSQPSVPLAVTLQLVESS